MAAGCEARDGALVPFEAEARPFRCHRPVDCVVWLRENRAGDIKILKPMNGRRDREQMGAGLDKNMARDWKRRRLGLAHTAVP